MKTRDNSNNSNKGRLRIEMDENHSCQVVFEPVNSTVWLHKAELSSLFGATIQVIHSSLEAIVKSGIVDVEKTCRYDLYVGGNRVRYDIREVSLEVIIAMAFRIDSLQTKALREWVARRCLHPGVDLLPPLSNPADFCMN